MPCGQAAAAGRVATGEDQLVIVNLSDRPIIFSGPMVQALLDGRKTMTRRLAQRAETNIRTVERTGESYRPTPWQRAVPGVRLWVKENFQIHEGTPDHPPEIVYAATEERHGTLAWRPSIYMPRALSRLTLVVTATKIERLKDISEEDAAAEGVSSEGGKHWVAGFNDETYTTYSKAEAFRGLWEAIHGKGAWRENPEVVALTFTVHKQNIDSAESAF